MFKKEKAKGAVQELFYGAKTRAATVEHLQSTRNSSVATLISIAPHIASRMLLPESHWGTIAAAATTATATATTTMVQLQDCESRKQSFKSLVTSTIRKSKKKN